jgi:hypothetical protein
MTLTQKVGSLLLCVCVGLGALPADAAVSASLRLDSSPLREGGSASIMLVSNRALPQVVGNLPKIDGLEWLKGTQRTQNVNGRLSYIVEYRFWVSKNGNFKLPPLRVREGNGQPTAVTVRPFDVKPRVYSINGKPLKFNDMVYMEIDYNGSSKPPAQLYQGQSFPISIKLYIDARIRVMANMFNTASFPEVEIDNVAFRDYSKQNRGSSKFAVKDVTISPDRTKRILEYPCAISAIRTGTVRGTVRHLVPLQDPEPRTRRDPFSIGFGIQRTDVLRRQLEMVIPPIKVLPVPDDPDPSTPFLGLIGTWDVKMTLDKTSVKVGEDVALQLTATGVGNVESFTPPKIELPGFQVYPPEVSIHIANPAKRGDRSVGSVKWLLVPKKEEARLPTFTMKSFDAKSGAYQTREFKLNMEVTPGELPVGTEVFNGTSGTPLVGTPTVLNQQNILYIRKTLGPSVILPLWRQSIVPGVVCAVAGPVLFLLMLFWAARQDKMMGSDAFRRRREAERSKAKVFAAVRKASENDLPNVVREALLPYVLAVLELPPGTTISELVVQLDDQELIDMLRQAEAGGFMPGGGQDIDAGRLLQRVTAAVS